MKCRILKKRLMELDHNIFIEKKRFKYLSNSKNWDEELLNLSKKNKTQIEESFRRLT